MQNPRNLPAIRSVGSEQKDMEVIHPRLKRVRSESIDRDFYTFVCVQYVLGANQDLMLKHVGDRLDVHV